MVAFGPCIIVLSLIGMVMEPVPKITNIISGSRCETLSNCYSRFKTKNSCFSGNVFKNGEKMISLISNGTTCAQMDSI
jgi:hypothetical protein